MALKLEGGCQCGAVTFTVQSHTPVPYQRCYCSICRVSAGGGGHSVNIGAVAESLHVEGEPTLGVFNARHDDGRVSTAERYFCRACGSQLWLYDARWPDQIHPLASAITTPLPVPPSVTHIMLDDKPDWVRAEIREGDATFATFPDISLADWHKARSLWVD